MNDYKFSKILETRTLLYLASFVGRKINDDMIGEMAEGLLKLRNDFALELSKDKNKTIIFQKTFTKNEIINLIEGS